VTHAVGGAAWRERCRVTAAQLAAGDQVPLWAWLAFGAAVLADRLLARFLHGLGE